MDNQTVNILKNRRSLRLFDSKEIEKEKINLLKKLTLRAPSAGNMNMYSIIEVTDQTKKEELSKICDNQPMITKAPLVWVFLADIERWFRWMKNGGSEERIKKEVRFPDLGDMHLALQDAIITSSYASIAAEALGLGSCFIGDIIENYEKLQKLFNLPEYAIPASMLIMGYPKQKEKTPQTFRPEPKWLFMENEYKSYSPDECLEMYKKHEDSYRERKILPLDNTGTFADYYFNRKYSSSFMDEMNRSSRVFISRWCKNAIEEKNKGK